jgi:small conductance mechanosensitive channel
MLPFHVVIDTPDNQRITVPNTLLTANPVRNNSVLTTRRVQWTLTVGPARDLAGVRRAILDRLRSEPRVRADPPPEVYVSDWAEDKRTVTVNAWLATPDYMAVKQEMLEALGRSVVEQDDR